MCDVCAEFNINTYLADTRAKQYEKIEQTSPGFLQTTVKASEVDEVLTDVYYGNAGHAFFAGAGVATHQDLVKRLRELSRPPVEH